MSRATGLGLMACLLASACSDSQSRHRSDADLDDAPTAPDGGSPPGDLGTPDALDADAPADVGPDMSAATDDAGEVPPDLLAPACPAATPTQCWRQAAAVSVEISSRDVALPRSLHGIVSVDDGAALLSLHQNTDDYDAEWRLTPISAFGTADEDAVLGRVGTGSGLVSRGAVTAIESGLAVAWRQPRRTPEGRQTGMDVFAALVAGSDITRFPAFQSTAVADGDEVPEGVAAVAGTGADWSVVSTDMSGIVEGPPGEPGALRIATDSPPVGPVVAARIGPDRVAVVWEEAVSTYERRVLAAALIADDVATSRLVFDSDLAIGSDPVALIQGGAVFVARFQRDYASLSDSVLRVARLDADLRRIEPDRWFGGWGGLAPSGTALVSWRGGAIALWRALDRRYGSNPVLFMQPIPTDDCGIPAVEPALVLPEHEPAGADLVAVADDSSIWVAVAGVRSPNSADVYRLEPCE